MLRAWPGVVCPSNVRTGLCPSPLVAAEPREREPGSGMLLRAPVQELHGCRYSRTAVLPVADVGTGLQPDCLVAGSIGSSALIISQCSPGFGVGAGHSTLGQGTSGFLDYSGGKRALRG